MKKSWQILTLLASLVTGAHGVAHARMLEVPGLADRLFHPVRFISPRNFADSLIEEGQRQRALTTFCTQLEEHFRKFNWRDKPCGTVTWKVELRTAGGHPLVYASFGSGPRRTLVLGGVHPDELTPVPIGFRIAEHLTKNPDLIAGKYEVVVAPLVNPDGFLNRKSPTRTNLSGVDLNRNFFTLDWYEKATRLWSERRQKAPGHFPGYFPNSEIETIFQIQMIDRLRPDKILSIHAPLGFLDYDGPGDGLPSPPTATQRQARQLVQTVSEKSRNYRVVDYSFFPGSLGNFAGNERHIPTVTLEFETTDPRKVDTYWGQFLPGILETIQYPFSSAPEVDAKEGDNASTFSEQYEEPKQNKTI